MGNPFEEFLELQRNWVELMDKIELQKDKLREVIWGRVIPSPTSNYFV